MDQSTNMPYITEVYCSFNTYKSADRTYLKSKRKWQIFIYILLAILMVECLVLLFVFNKRDAVVLSMTGICVVYLPLINLIRLAQIKKSYNTNRALHNSTIRYAFYENDFEQSTAVTSSRVRYEALYSAIEDDVNILLFMSSRQYLIIQKKNCSEELLSFLHMKMNEINSRKGK